jgi:hypothetical protein
MVSYLESRDQSTNILISLIVSPPRVSRGFSSPGYQIELRTPHLDLFHFLRFCADGNECVRNCPYQISANKAYLLAAISDSEYAYSVCV